MSAPIEPQAPDPRAPTGSPDSIDSEPAIRRDPTFWAIAILALVTVCASAWLISGLGDASLSGGLAVVESTAGSLIVVLMALRLRRTKRLDPRVSRAWSLIALALALYCLGAVVDLAAGSMPSANLMTSLGVGLKVACYPLISIGLTLLPRPGRTRYDRVLFSLDVTIAAASAAILLWHFCIFPAAQAGGRDAIAAVGASFFPVYDAALLFSIAGLVVRGLPQSARSALTIAAFAIASMFAADLVASLQSLKGTNAPGNLSDLLYPVAWVLLAVASYAQWRIRDTKEPPTGLFDYARSFPWLPYAAVAVAFVAPAIRDWNDLNMLRQHIPATGFLIMLVIARLGVTARHNATLAAAERERLAAAVDQAAEAVLTTDRDDRITYVNPAFSRITGYAADEVLGRIPEFLDDPADPARLVEMRSTLARGDSWEGRLQQRGRDGGTLYVDMAIAPVRDSFGAVVGSVAVSRDISRERTLEIQLAQAQRMEAIGNLAGGVAHDFNNMLTAIRGFSELAAMELGKDHPVAGDIDQIRIAADRAAALTRSLLIFSRREVPQPQIIDINGVLAALTPLLGQLIPENVELIVRVDPRLGSARVDATQIEQVVMNLAVNARDAMPSGGTLTIATTNVDLDADFVRTHVGASEGKFVVLTVSDTGTGMTPEVMEHAFEPFFTTKERSKGTGLGLSTVFGIVRASGGFVRVESEPGAGSAFHVYLPGLDPLPRPAEPAGVAAKATGGRETILVAEDEEAVRSFVERVLTGAGYQVTAAPDGAAAIDLASQLPQLHLLVTDVVMPGVDGIQLAAHLTGTRPNLPVIYASGYSDQDIPERGSGNLKAWYLPKPFTAENLLKHVREALDQRPAAAADQPSEATSGD
jgi:PAS domain S-box-containing protein